MTFDDNHHFWGEPCLENNWCILFMFFNIIYRPKLHPVAWGTCSVTYGAQSQTQDIWVSLLMFWCSPCLIFFHHKTNRSKLTSSKSQEATKMVYDVELSVLEGQKRGKLASVKISIVCKNVHLLWWNNLKILHFFLHKNWILVPSSWFFLLWRPRMTDFYIKIWTSSVKILITWNAPHRIRSDASLLTPIRVGQLITN